MCTEKKVLSVNIYICLGSKSEEYREALINEINHQKLKFKIINNFSDKTSAEAIIYSDDCEISDFSEFPKHSYIFSTYAGVEKTLLNKTIKQPLVRLIDNEMTECMAEWCTAHIMRYHLDIDKFIQRKSKEWLVIDNERPLAHQVSIGILGLGILGQATACKLRKLGFKIRGWSMNPKNIPGIISLSGEVGLNEILTSSDYIILLLPLTNKTTKIINERSIKLFKNGVKLINAGRGGLIEEKSLINGLDNGKISACTLDVFNQEPLPPSHPFWDHERITITPHISAPTRLKSSVKSIVENIKRLEKGEKPIGLVERQRSY